MKNIPEYNIDFYSDSFIKNPYPHYAKMRSLGPIVFLPKLSNYAITQYHFLKQALLDYKRFSSANGVAGDEIGSKFLKGNIVASDPPIHQTMRKVMMPPLMPKNLKSITPVIKKEAKDLIVKLLIKKQFDAVEDLAQFLPLTIVRDLVGLKGLAKENMLIWAAASFNILGKQNKRGKEGIKAIKELRKFISTQLKLNKVKPGSWIDRILKMSNSNEVDVNIANYLIRDYINPSLDTTISAISHLIFLLARNNSEWKKLQNRPDLTKNAVNEAIRIGSPIRSFSRFTKEKVKIDNYIIPKNSRVMMLFASANRDELVFENPNSFNISREFIDHLGFGYGIHSCVGMHLAQIEMISILEAMIPRVKKIDIGEPKVLMNNTICGFSKLPTTLIPLN